MATIDIKIATNGANSVTKEFMYNPPPSVSGKLCRCYVDFVAGLNGFLVTSSWNQIHSTFADLTSVDTYEFGNSKVIGFGVPGYSSNKSCHVLIPDGPHVLSITLSPYETIAANYNAILRISLEPVDGNNHYERLPSFKSGPSIII